jgi:hypothetical protein
MGRTAVRNHVDPTLRYLQADTLGQLRFASGLVRKTLYKL